jgi:hypothetical protein
MSGGGWVGDLIAEKNRQAETARLEAEQELLRHKKFCALAPTIWSNVERAIRSSLDDFNRKVSGSANRLNITMPGSYSMFISSNARPFQAFMITLNIDSGMLSFGHPADVRTQRALAVKIDQESHWSFKDSDAHVPIECVDQFILSDFLKSMPL